MGDTYQAIFDAVGNRIGRPDVGGIVREVCRDAFDISWMKTRIEQEFQTVAYEWQRPSVLFRPSLKIDGNQWCALYGENMQDGVCGFGDSPALALEDFDKSWIARLSQAVTAAQEKP